MANFWPLIIVAALFIGVSYFFGIRPLRQREKQHDQIDLIITDYTMPKITGIELAKHARTLNTNIPVVLYTGFSESLSDEELKSAGIHALVRKPVNVSEMFGLVRSVLA